jgi:hypothetical protein
MSIQLKTAKIKNDKLPIVDSHKIIKEVIW